jgi:hypothetical protein
MRKIVIFLIIVGVLVGILGIYYYERNVYSKGNLKLEILGPEEVQAFDEIEYVVKYKNNGNTILEEPVLTFQYPENSLPSDNNSKRLEKTLEDIYPGEEKTLSFKARLFGKENEMEQTKATLKYRPKNLKAFYTSETTFTTKIEFVPLTFEFDLPSKIEPGREFQFSLNYFSNSGWPLSNLRVKIEYPSGFEFISSQPQALEKTEWDLPFLNKTEGGRIEIRGKLSGEVKEQKIFRATLGFWQEGESTLLKEITEGTEIRESSLSIFQRINGVSQYVANPGDVLHYEIFFRNIGEGQFRDLFLVSKLEGRAFDFDTLKSESGQFNKGDNSLVWDWREVPQLQFLGQGEEGKVEFWINLKKDWQTSSPQDKNFSLKNKVILSQSKEEFETKINSKLEISQKGFFSDEVFGNSGPLPPKVGENTTYTIIWQAKNYYNDVKNVKVKAALPPQVKLTGKIFPEGSGLTFDSRSREIVWDAGDLAPATGILNQPPNVSFQVSLTPVSSQLGQMPDIIGEAKITGEDDWTGVNLEARDAAVDTTLPDDPTIGAGEGVVKQ